MHRLRAVRSRDSMADAFGMAEAHRILNAIGARGFPGMDGATEAGITRAREDVCKIVSRKSLLIPSEADAYDALRLTLQRKVEVCFSAFGAKVTHHIHDQKTGNPGPRLRLLERGINSSDHSFDIGACVEIPQRRRRKHQLDMAHRLGVALR